MSPRHRSAPSTTSTAKATTYSFSKADTNKVKGVAIIMMLFHHCFLNPERYAGQEVIFTPFPEGRVNQICNAFKICVGLFTLLSAYGMTKSYQGLVRRDEYDAEGITRSIARRYINLMSGYMFVFVCLQIYSLVMGFGRYTQIYGTGKASVLNFLIDFLGLGFAFGNKMFVATFWYMALAQAVILVVPLLYSLLRSHGWIPLLGLTLLARVFFPVSKSAPMLYLPNYLFAVSLGMVAAEYDLFERIRSYRLSIPAGSLVKFVSELLFVCVALLCRQHTRSTAQLPFWEGIVCFSLIVLLFEFVNTMPVVGTSLEFLGKHSMNIFLIHNFIRVVWYYDFTYSFKHFALIVLVLLLISLALSLLVEGLKKLLRYDKLTLAVRTAVDERLACDEH